jgi:hypothetical protein
MKLDKARQVSLSLKEEEIERYKKLAEAEGKSFSRWVRDKVEEAIRREVRETNLLDRLIRMLEELPKRLEMQEQKGGSSEELREIVRLLVYIVKFLEMESEYLIVLEVKRKEFQARKEELKRSIGIEI